MLIIKEFSWRHPFNILSTLFVLVSSLVFLNFSSLSAQSETAINRCENLGKGVNLSNWLEAYWLEENYPEKDFYTEDIIANIKNTGFQSIRLPVTFERLFYEDESGYKLGGVENVLSIVDSVIAWTEKYELNLIIDNHHGYNLADFSIEENISRLLSVWLFLAERYSYASPDHIIFELYNEPSNISNHDLFKIFDNVINDLRDVGVFNTIVVGASDYNSFEYLMNSSPYEDDNLIYSFHFYEPYDFTHQFLSWTELTERVEYPSSSWDYDKINSILTKIQKWAFTNHIPVMVGELGVGTEADPQSRCNWITDIMNIFMDINIPWFYWDIRGFENSFGFFEDEIIDIDKSIACFSDAMGLTIVENDGYFCQSINTKVYPTLVHDKIYIEGNHIEDVRIISVHGIVVSNLESSLNELTYIDVTHLASGAYFINILVSRQWITFPFIKI